MLVLHEPALSRFHPQPKHGGLFEHVVDIVVQLLLVPFQIFNFAGALPMAHRGNNAFELFHARRYLFQLFEEWLNPLCADRQLFHQNNSFPAAAAQTVAQLESGSPGGSCAEGREVDLI